MCEESIQPNLSETYNFQSGLDVRASSNSVERDCILFSSRLSREKFLEANYKLSSSLLFVFVRIECLRINGHLRISFISQSKVILWGASFFQTFVRNNTTKWYGIYFLQTRFKRATHDEQDYRTTLCRIFFIDCFNSLIRVSLSVYCC